MDTVQIRFTIQDEASGGLKRILVPIEDIKAAMGEATKAVKEATSAFDTVAATCIKFNNVRDAIAGISDTLDGILAPSRDFEDAMRKANTMAGLSEDEFQQMKRSIRGISEEVPLSAAALSEGLYAVVSNGFDASEQLEVLKASARSAVGGCADLSKVVGVTATMIKNYGMAGSDAAEIQDKIQLTARNGVTSFEELAAALPNVTANAATLGVSVDELLASYATLTGVSGNTAAVSTQLGAIFTALAKPSSEASKLAAEMGTQFDAAAIRAAGGMQNFLTSLSADIDSYASKSGLLRETIVATLFGSAEAVRAFTPITGELAAKFGENIETMKSSAGTMDAAFEQMSLTGEAKAQSFQNSFGAMLDTIQEYCGDLLSGVQRGLDVFGGISSAMPALQFFNSHILRSKIVTSAWGGVTRIAGLAVGGLTGGLGRMRAAIMRTTVAQRAAAVASKVWAVAQAGLNVILNMNPIGLIVLGITALIGVVYGVVQAFKRWGDEALLLFGPLGSMILAFKTHWDSIVEAFKSDGIIGGIRRIGQVLMDVLLRPVQKLLGWVAELTGWDWAKKAATWVQEVRVENNLATDEEQGKTQTDPATGKPVKKEAAATTAPAAGSLGIGAATKATAAKATSQAGQIKRIDITIDKVVESFTVSTTNLQQSASEVRDMVARALVDAVNDVNYAL